MDGSSVHYGWDKQVEEHNLTAVASWLLSASVLMNVCLFIAWQRMVLLFWVHNKFHASRTKWRCFNYSSIAVSIIREVIIKQEDLKNEMTIFSSTIGKGQNWRSPKTETEDN